MVHQSLHWALADYAQKFIDYAMLHYSQNNYLPITSIYAKKFVNFARNYAHGVTDFGSVEPLRSLLVMALVS